MEIREVFKDFADLLVYAFKNYIPLKSTADFRLQRMTHPSKKNSRYRTSRVIFCIVAMLLIISLIWPGYSIFASATPLILGFPLSFAWIIFCTIAGFVALLLLYRSDYKKDKTE